MTSITKQTSDSARRMSSHAANSNWRMPRIARALLAVLAICALVSVAVSCGDDSDDSNDTSDAVAIVETTTTAAPASESESGSAAPASTTVATDAAQEAETSTTTTTTTTAAAAAVVTTTTAAAAPASESESESDSDAAADTTVSGSLVERIVSISPTATEMVFAIGAGDHVVAVDQYSYYPDAAPVTELDGWNPNIEAIASYEPDLVLMQGAFETAEQLEALGIEVWSHNAPATFDDVYLQIEQLGEITGLTANAAALNADISSQIDELVEAAPNASGLSYYHELDNTLYTVTSSTFVGEVYNLFGLENVADPADSDGGSFGYPQLSDEYLVNADPDLIFLADTVCCGQNAQTVAERPGWDQLTAVQNGRIVELNDDIASRWGPRLGGFIAAISEALVSLDAAG